MKAVRGMHDLFGDEIAKWQWVENQVKSVFSSFGFKEIRTPVLEHIEVFSKTVGDETDIVEKQMYQVAKESETLVLRPEGTAGFMRAVLEHQLHRDPIHQRYFYYLPMFRHERPQKGRLRQFSQFGAELIQDPSAEADAEVILLLDAIYKKFGIHEYEVRINSLGCNDCRPKMKETLLTFFQPKLSQLCELCQKRFERAPLRILDCKRDACISVSKSAPSLASCLCENCKTHHEKLKKRLNEAQLVFIDDPSIVRGLDYYSSTAFEFTSSLLGAQSALGGGGRYDQLAGRFGEKPFPAVGFALGMERLMIALESQNKIPKHEDSIDFFLAPLGEPALEHFFSLSIELKKSGKSCQLTYDSQKSLKSQLKQANRLNAKWAVILGEEELKQNLVILKNMQTQTQSNVSLNNLLSTLLERSAHS